MARRNQRVLIWAVVVTLLAASGGDDGGLDTSSTTSTISAAEPSTTTSGADQPVVVASEGDDGPVARAVQFMLVCNGYIQTVVEGRDEELVPDGMYGKITTSLVDRLQRDLGLARTGTVMDSDLYERIASTCNNTRSVYLKETRLEIDAGGYASPTYTDTWTFWAQSGQRVTISSETPIDMGLSDPNGVELIPVATTDLLTIDITTSGSHRVRVEAGSPMTYEVTVRLPPHYSVVKLQSTGLDVIDFGDGPAQVVGLLSGILGDPTLESDWSEADDECIRWRQVAWGDGEFSVYFTDAARDADDNRTFAGEGREHFAAWRIAAPSTGEPGIPPFETPSGLMIGDGPGRVEAVYGDRVAVDGIAISIVDGIIIGELTAENGTVAWLSSGAALCATPEADPDEDEEADDS